MDATAMLEKAKEYIEAMQRCLDDFDDTERSNCSRCILDKDVVVEGSDEDGYVVPTSVSLCDLFDILFVDFMDDN